MSIFYQAGEIKTRPGTYHRYTSSGTEAPGGAIDGVCAIAVQANWGEPGAVTKHTAAATITKLYGGEDYGPGCTVKAATAMCEGGAQTVYVVRMGSGGAKGSKAIGSTVRAEAKYVGTKPLSLAIQDALEDSAKKTVTVYSGAQELEKFSFEADGTNEPKNLAQATSGSAYITVTALTETGIVDLVEAAEGTLSGGANPTVTNESYTAAWEALEPYAYNIIALDGDDDASMSRSMLLQEYVKAAYRGGKFCMAAVGQPSTVSWSVRLANARRFNDEKIVFLGEGFKRGAAVYDGALAVCAAAGAIAATPASEGIVHKAMPGATEVLALHTNSQYEEAIANGMLMLSTSADGIVWFDAGINTLVNLGANQDSGWKKIRRTKTRFEVMNRVDRAVAPKVGRVNCNSDGIADIIQTAQVPLNAMVSEGKLYDGATIFSDPENPPSSDSAWFIIEAVDIDSLEKIYLHYQFRNTNI